MKAIKRCLALMLVLVLSVCTFTNTGLEAKAATDSNGNPIVEITKLTTDLPSPQYVGTTINIMSEVINMSGYRHNTINYYVIKDGVSKKLNVMWNGEYEESWTPTESGEYTLRCEAVDSGYDHTATKEMKFTILDKTNIYFDNSLAKWSAVYAYVWNNSSDATVFAGTKVENNIYSFDIKGSYKNILFKNTAGKNSWDKQTKDLVMPTSGNKCYKPSSSANKASGAWYDYIVNTPTPTPVVTPTAAPTKEPLVVTLTADKKTPIKPGDTVNFDGTVSGFAGYYTYSTFAYKITDRTTDEILTVGQPQSAGNWAYEFSWTPEKEGKYAVTFYVIEYSARTAEKTINFDVVKSNTATVYYSTNWTKANIHYRVGNGAWTVVPGKAMTKTSEVAGYNFKYVIDLGTATEATVCFNDGNGNWDSRNGANYKIPVGTYGVKNQQVIEIKPVVTPVATATAKPTAAPTVKPTVVPTVKPTVAPTTVPTVAPTATPVFEITKIITDVASPQKVGTTITLNAEIKNVGYIHPNGGYDIKFVITKDGVEYARTNSFGGSGAVATWTPIEPGTYTITASTASKYGVATAEKSINYTITDNKTEKTIIYYSTSWSNAYIHYKVGNGAWTSVPGKQMTKTTEVAGYNFKFDIDLGTATEATVCFNNGNGTWESNDGKNYIVVAGVQGIKNKKVTPIDLGLNVALTTDKKVGGTYNDIKMTANVAGGTAPYSYVFTVYYPNGTSQKYPTTSNTVNVPSIVLAGTYVLMVDVTDAKGDTARATISPYEVEGPKWESVTTSVASPQKVGTAITINAKYVNVQPDRYNFYDIVVVDKNGNVTDVANDTTGVGTWTPTKAGDYTIKVTFTTYLGAKSEYTMPYTIKDAPKTNTVKVYYNNSSWTNAYVHYKTNSGAWTSVPGVKMTASDNSAYKWMYTIDLGTDTGATVCFNNGSGSWDSKNGANYKVGTGSYAIANGNIVSVK